MDVSRLNTPSEAFGRRIGESATAKVQQAPSPELNRRTNTWMIGNATSAALFPITCKSS